MTNNTNQNPNPSLNCAAPPLFSQAAAAAAVCATALLAGISFQPTFRGESVRADLSTVKCRFLYETGRSQARVASKIRIEFISDQHRLSDQNNKSDGIEISEE
ncbi:hypothetical protein F511_27875 [Dorcoceras hygrometricum]|uniref:Uncharacterized protein n=1 Tax=Dorcoceras hygrometricum TaxID=472368 RepID=A0A2Z7A6X1_9LAMI|nr:hypothetical protein F511_27875 [Dorcoceras hygrometricum]